jgi:pyruvate dehydrogenase E2 component (dihydrolipoamide acetyltransferase)
MANEIKMPASGQTATESVIVVWHVKEGDEVERGDMLFDIETDKATLSVESYAKGTVLKRCFGEGDKVETGRVVAYIGNKGEVISETSSEVQPQAVGEDDYRPIFPREKKLPIAAVQKTELSDNATPLASPAARKLAKEKGLNIIAIHGSLKRVVKRDDVAEWITAGEAVGLEYDSVKPTSMRRAIARRMLQSATEAPQFTVTIKADMSEMEALRNRMNQVLEPEGVKLSYNDLLTRCVCIAVKKVPYINSVYTDDEIRLIRHVNVGIAVGLTEGLVVPVIERADTLSLREIAQTSKELIDTARGGYLKPEQMQGGTITISNLGMFGISRFTALINRPESAILAVGAIIDTPVGVDGSITLRPVMDVTASFDHRVVDGSVGAQFMAALKQLIEQPVLTLL